MRNIFLLAIALVLTDPCSASARNTDDTRLHFESLCEYDLPESKIEGAYYSIFNDNVIIAGGIVVDSSHNKKFSDKVYQHKDGGWIEIGKLRQGIAYGASVQLSDRLVCIGGITDNGISSDVSMLCNNNGKLFIKELPPLPLPCAYPSAAIKNGEVYVVVTNEEKKVNSLFSMDINNFAKGWKWLADMPGGAIIGGRMSVHFDGNSDVLYLMGGQRDDVLLNENWAYRLDGHINEWKRLSDLPEPLTMAASLTEGYSGVILLGGKIENGNNSNIYVYYPITDAWSIEERMQDDLLYLYALNGKNSIKLISSENIVICSLNAAEMGGFSTLDFIALSLYLILIIFVAKYFSNKNKSSKDFFLGGGKIPFWAAGLSMRAWHVSAIGFMSIPAKSFMTNWSYFGGVLTWFVVVPIVVYAFVPFYRKLNVTSAYEYLEFRFNKSVRKFIAGLYLIFQLIGRSSIVIFLPAIALAAVTGMSPVLCIVIIGGLATIYTTMGGMKAVIWVDVVQTFVLFGAIFLCIGFVLSQIDMGFSEVLKIAVADKKFSFGRMDWDVTAPVFWVIVLGNIFNRVGTNATDQSVVQRYLTTKDEKTTAKALWTDALVSIPWALCVFGMGTALYVFYKTNPQMLTPTVTNDEIVPFFIAQNLPSGVSGVVIAGIFAAAISSVDSSIHSSTTVIMRDFMENYLRKTNDGQQVKTARIITVLIGLIGTIIAVAMTFFDIKSVWDVVLEIASLFTGAMTGVFLLGIFSEKTNGKGVMVGAVSSAIILLVVKTYTPLNFFLYSAIGILSCVVIGYLASFVFVSDKSTDGLTIYTVKDN